MMFTRNVRVYSWGDSKPDKGARSCQISFSHPATVESACKNDPNKTSLAIQLTKMEDEKWKIQFQDHVVFVHRSPFDDIWITFTSDNMHIKIDEFVWYEDIGARKNPKKAPEIDLKNFNDSFYLEPPPPPRITQPINNAKSHNRQPVIKGTAEPNSKVVILVDGVSVGLPTNSGEFGTWSFSIPHQLDPKKNKFRFTAKLIDSNGYESEESTPVNYMIHEGK